MQTLNIPGSVPLSVPGSIQSVPLNIPDPTMSQTIIVPGGQQNQIRLDNKTFQPFKITFFSSFFIEKFLPSFQIISLQYLFLHNKHTKSKIYKSKIQI